MTKLVQNCKLMNDVVSRQHEVATEHATFPSGRVIPTSAGMGR
ncbi:hypothetical protein [Limosilactobacillus vaginalis]|nr:hypothetical protein [Limosilactobacillus vaginalis]